MTPRQIVKELDRYIVGQKRAKKAVAIALRNRWRRQQVVGKLRDEIMPNNIIMIGSTGVGKTEIARRLASLASAPFIKVEASKFTEVGYVGRDVESMVRDLMDTAVTMVEREKEEEVIELAELLANERILDILFPDDHKNDPKQSNELKERHERTRDRIRKKMDKGKFEDKMIEVEISNDPMIGMQIFGPMGMEDIGMNIKDMISGHLPKSKRSKKMSVSEAREILTESEAAKLIDGEDVIRIARERTENNGIIFLDEIDKVGNDYRGDPSSALLEALDPEQNTTFNDHYLEVDYDLSDVMFVTTGNTLNILPPLLDRMEVIRIPGYTEDEKINIADKFLLPKQIKENGIKQGELDVKDGTIKQIIRSYTREAGVRNLEREISKISRKVVKQVINGEKQTVKVNDNNISDFLGIKKFKYGEVETEDKVGVVTGLAWTEFGGEILKIETVHMPGKGRMQITGKLGEVMQESVKAAKSYVRSKSLEYGIIPPLFEKNDFHIHVPEGATPKDGPSAGIGMVTSIVSSITNNPVDREIAMTGEVTITGQVLSIGGLKEKLLAAHRAGIKKLIIPKDNEKDLADIPQKIKDDIKIITVETVDEVLKLALKNELKRVEWQESENISKSEKEDKSQASIQ